VENLEDVKFNGLIERALKLLGNGVSQEATAAALGVTPSYITQLISIPEFAEKVSELRYESLQKHNERDSEYDSAEDALLKKLHGSIPLLIRPMEILRAIQVINNAKRRGVSSPESITNKQTQVTLLMPTQLIQKFTQNINNQVVSISGQELVTIDSKALINRVEKEREVINDPSSSSTKQITSGIETLNPAAETQAR